MKYCICGTSNPSDAKQCSYCGRDLTNVKAEDDLKENLNGPGRMNEHPKRTAKGKSGIGNSEILAAIGGTIIVLLAVIIYLMISGNRMFQPSDEKDAGQQVLKDQTAGEQQTLEGIVAESTAQASSASPDQTYSSQGLDLPFVDPYASGIYAENLDPDEYYSWHYDKTFFFSYPSKLYQRIEGDNTLFEVLDGNNEIRYDFYSNEEGAHLCYQKINIENGVSDEAAASDWFESETGSLYDTEVILKRMNTDGKSRCVFTGYVDSGKTISVYEVITAMNGNLYRMRVEMPVPVNSTDRSQKFYITECLYRECGFSGSSSGSRSYQEYLEAE